MASQTYVDGDWVEGNVPLIGADSHAIWLGSIAFDGARAFEGVTPDLVIVMAGANDVIWSWAEADFVASEILRFRDR